MPSTVDQIYIESIGHAQRLYRRSQNTAVVIVAPAAGQNSGGWFNFPFSAKNGSCGYRFDNKTIRLSTFYDSLIPFAEFDQLRARSLEAGRWAACRVFVPRYITLMRTLHGL